MELKTIPYSGEEDLHKDMHEVEFHAVIPSVTLGLGLLLPQPLILLRRILRRVATGVKARRTRSSFG